MTRTLRFLSLRCSSALSVGGPINAGPSSFAPPPTSGIAVAAAAAAAAVAAAAASSQYSSPAACSSGAQAGATAVFACRKDHYGGRIVSGSAVAECGDDAALFASRLKASLDEWRASGVRGVWLEVPAAQAGSLLAPALAQGLEMHHIDRIEEHPGGDSGDGGSSGSSSSGGGGGGGGGGRCSMTLTYWFPGERGEASSLPPGNSHTVGVGAVVMNAAGELLAVQERSGPAAALNKKASQKKDGGFWKMPTGLVGAGEDACEAAKREVLEETGVEVVVEKLVALREAHNAPRNTSTNMFLVFLCRPADEGRLAIRRQESEILRCEWMNADEFLRRQGTVMKPGSLYYKLNELAVDVARSRKDSNRGGRGQQQQQEYAMDIHELPMGFRPGTNRAYFCTPPATATATKP